LEGALLKNNSLRPLVPFSLDKQAKELGKRKVLDNLSWPQNPKPFEANIPEHLRLYNALRKTRTNNIASVIYGY